MGLFRTISYTNGISQICSTYRLFNTLDVCIGLDTIAHRDGLTDGRWELENQ